MWCVADFSRTTKKKRADVSFFPVTRIVRALHHYGTRTNPTYIRFEYRALQINVQKLARVCLVQPASTAGNGDQINDEQAKKSIATHHHWFSCLINNNNKTNFIPEV
jgi:hypothetical protein